MAGDLPRLPRGPLAISFEEIEGSHWTGVTLPGGTEVVIVEERESWLRIRLADGRETWVAKGSVTPVQ